MGTIGQAMVPGRRPSAKHATRWIHKSRTSAGTPRSRAFFRNACPESLDGATARGLVVSLFSSQASVIELLLEGSDEPLQVTPGHMIFSLDRETWIPAGKLQRGEKLATLDGQVRLLEIRGGGDPLVVWNLEILGSHRYHVGSAAVLAHNMCETKSTAGQYLKDSWHRGTFPNRTQSVRYHLAKHGKGRTPSQYTRDAMDFFRRNKHLGQDVFLKDGTAGIKIQTKVKIPGQKAQRVGGYWTKDGKLVTFWD